MKGVVNNNLKQVSKFNKPHSELQSYEFEATYHKQTDRLRLQRYRIKIKNTINLNLLFSWALNKSLINNFRFYVVYLFPHIRFGAEMDPALKRNFIATCNCNWSVYSSLLVSELINLIRSYLLYPVRLPNNWVRGSDRTFAYRDSNISATILINLSQGILAWDRDYSGM